MAAVVCWRSGEVEVVSRAPAGSVTLMRGPRKRLEKLLSACARHAYDGRTFLVPGVPEADTDQQALDAVERFQRFLIGSMARMSS
ncbi:host nuclease inhibitor protein [Bosea sp. (in: a-proteobacteria)]|jgi:hypothetical protein|uniref:host nuclease inhibitor protein n=1 Tax=Bosea sp. (in: a-proteobacteria) TaxID=1871050 RepID=UPI003564146E